ncbi:hypothetical protein PUN28_005115 [Cardiocondyla obscurior]|uniref:Uncharacterized protein n=1 Tax=Cardiocondyla obscurior TaxID=286306 RepID=A0AAW2GG31_9HYME
MGLDRPGRDDSLARLLHYSCIEPGREQYVLERAVSTSGRGKEKEKKKKKKIQHEGRLEDVSGVAKKRSWREEKRKDTRERECYIEKNKKNYEK